MTEERESILEEAIDRLDEAANADRDNRYLAKTDLEFAVGEQWSEADKQERDLEGRPCLTINAMPQFIRAVTGQIRSMNPAIRVMGSDAKATREVADIYEGLIRQIEYRSDASSVYEAAAESAAACGIGHFRIRTDYCDDQTFDQHILIERIYNPFAVFWDPQAKDPTRKDAEYCFIVTEMDEDEFETSYPDKRADPITAEHKDTVGFAWNQGNTVTVAEYFWKEYEDQMIYQLRGGQVVTQKIAGMDIVRERKTKVCKVKWAKITRGEILEGPTEIAGCNIPVIPVVGEEWHLGETTYRSSVVRFAKDPQILYNYARSAQAEVITLQPKAPYLVTAEQVAGYEDMWAQAGQKNRPYLVYNPDPQVGAPSRVSPPIPSQALMAEVQMASEDMKKTTGIYDASLGARSNETSGVAINARKMESEQNTSIYADNMVKSITQAGKIIVDMIPRVYDTKRAIQILGADDQEQIVVINDVLITQDGAQTVNDMTSGKYDVRIGVGPSYATKRAEAAEGMMSFMQAAPQAAPLIADLIAGMQDWPDADRVAERLKKMLPPGIAEPDEKQAQDPNAQAQMQAQQMQQMQAQQMAQAKAEADIREAEAKAKKAEADAIKAEAEAQKAQVEAGLATGQVDTAVRHAFTQGHAAAMSAPQPMIAQQGF